jgi:hypothetical protein
MIYRDTYRDIFKILQRYNDICGSLCFEMKIGQDDIEPSNSQLRKVRIAQNTYIYIYMYYIYLHSYIYIYLFIYLHRDRFAKYKRNSNSIVKKYNPTLWIHMVSDFFTSAKQG